MNPIYSTSFLLNYIAYFGMFTSLNNHLLSHGYSYLMDYTENTNDNLSLDLKNEVFNLQKEKLTSICATFGIGVNVSQTEDFRILIATTATSGHRVARPIGTQLANAISGCFEDGGAVKAFAYKGHLFITQEQADIIIEKLLPDVTFS